MSEVTETAEDKQPILFYGITAVALMLLCVLFILPATGTTARSELALMAGIDGGTRDVIGNTNQVVNANSTPQPAPIYSTMPGNYDRALTEAVNSAYGQGGGPNTRKRKLHELVALYPEHLKEICAHQLRYATMGEVHLRRDNEVEPYMNPKSTQRFATRTPATPDAASDEFIEIARAGAAADPNNAYFMEMVALGLFTQKKDEEGISALKQAAIRPLWDDYCWDEAEAHWRLVKSMGGANAVGRAAIMSGTLFPHYAQLRAMSRLTTYLAVKKEREGKRLDGLQIRHATMMAGSQMRAQSKTYIGNLVGIAMTTIAAGSPGGVFYGGFDEKAWTALDANQKSIRRLELYTNWTKSLGHPEEGSLAIAENQAAETIRVVGKDIEDSETGPFTVKSLQSLVKSWMMSLGLLANVCLMLVLTISAIIIRLVKADRGNAPLVVTGAILAIFVVVALASRWASDMNSLYSTVTNLSGGGNGMGDEESGLNSLIKSPSFIRASVLVISMLGPGFTLFCIGVGRLFSRRPERSVLATGLQTLGSVACLLLVLGYGSSVAETAKQETTLNNSIDRMVKHEGQYRAELKHVPWPK